MSKELTELQQLAHALLKKWYSVLCDKKETRDWFSFSDGVNIGYVQHSQFNIWYSFSQTYIPSRENGSWCQVMTQAEPTVENAEKTLAKNNHYDSKYPIKYYETLQQFINYEKKHRPDYGAINQNEVEQRIK